jgi:hypothetical protein
MHTKIELVAAEDFERMWRGAYSLVFSGRELAEGAFQPTRWRQFAMGAPAYYFSKDPSAVPVGDHELSAIYLSILQVARQRGDRELVGFLLGGPHLNPSVFHSADPTLSTFLEMRTTAVDGFDLHIFGPSATWGLSVSWEEEVAALAGDDDFVDAFVTACGGEALIRDSFEKCSAYLDGVSNRTRHLKTRLLSFSGWARR